MISLDCSVETRIEIEQNDFRGFRIPNERLRNQAGKEDLKNSIRAMGFALELFVKPSTDVHCASILANIGVSSNKKSSAKIRDHCRHFGPRQTAAMSSNSIGGGDRRRSSAERREQFSMRAR